MVKEGKDGGSLHDYFCDWCGYSWEQVVFHSRGENYGKHSHGSDQVKCPNCRNYITTWE